MNLQARLKRRSLIRSVGVHDALSALAAEKAGFDTLFLGGFGASASLFGFPDLNLLTLTEMASTVRRLTRRLRVPLIADGDTGHGGVHNVARTVREFEDAGAAGLILEDQTWPKRCGHFEGKSVVSADEMVERLTAARLARRRSHFVLVARTDARETHGFREAVRRARLYRAAGADVVFVEAPKSAQEVRALPAAVRAPLLINLLSGGKTPLLPMAEVERLGYRIAVFPIESLLVASKAVRGLFREIRERGSVARLAGEMTSFSELKNLLGLAEMLTNAASATKRRAHVGIR